MSEFSPRRAIRQLTPAILQNNALFAGRFPVSSDSHFVEIMLPLQASPVGRFNVDYRYRPNPRGKGLKVASQPENGTLTEEVVGYRLGSRLCLGRLRLPKVDGFNAEVTPVDYQDENWGPVHYVLDIATGHSVLIVDGNDIPLQLKTLPGEFSI